MSMEIAGTAAGISSGFRRVVDVFLAGAGLPFSQILSAERIERICGAQGCLFGQNRIYSTPVVLWAWLSQVLRDGKEAACQAAVASIVAACLERGEAPPTEDTGDYCRSRAKLAPQALKAISREVAEELEQAAEPGWLWKGTHHAKLVDGFTFTMPDTPANQAEYPQAKTQQPGVGLPIARATAIISLATGALTNLACGPYQGKETGETALLRSMLDSFQPGDVAVMDRYFCSFMMLAMLRSHGVHVCTRLHQRRSGDLRQGRRVGNHDRLMTWIRPDRPAWMDSAVYDRIPETLEVLVIRFTIHQPGRHPGDRGCHDADGFRGIFAGRHRRVVRLPLEHGVGHPEHQEHAPPRPSAVQDAGDGDGGGVGDDSRLQPDPHHGRRSGGTPRQAAATDQLRSGVPIHPLHMDAALRQPDICGHLAETPPPAARADCVVRGRQPTRSL